MKLVTWNCSSRYEDKHEKLVKLDADIIVIQECSELSMTEMNIPGEWNSWWIGENQNKGLGLLARAPWVILEKWALRPKWAGMAMIGGPAPIRLFPVWAHKSVSPDKEYIEQVHLLLDLIEQNPPTPFTIVVGDFNSNSKWDKDYKSCNHTQAVERFRKLGMESAYHRFFGVAQGAEEHPTLWFRKNKHNTFHIDYVFLSQQLLPKLKGVAVGRCDDWLTFSDHASVLVDLDL
jgi:exonuclease III